MAPGPGLESEYTLRRSESSSMFRRLVTVISVYVTASFTVTADAPAPLPVHPGPGPVVAKGQMTAGRSRNKLAGPIPERPNAS